MSPIQNITGLEKPLEKLVEVVSEGLGVVANEVFNFDAKKSMTLQFYCGVID